MARASSRDREYFARVAEQNRALAEERVPASLEEMFDRLDEIRRLHGGLARPGVTANDDGDMPGHLAFLERVRMVQRREACVGKGPTPDERCGPEEDASQKPRSPEREPR